MFFAPAMCYVLMYAMQTLRCCRIVAHVHDEVIIECRKDMSLDDF